MNPKKMLQQVQQMQAQMQQQMEALRVDGTAGGGMVKATMNGQKELLAVAIDKEAVDPADVEMLQDLVVAAVNDTNAGGDSSTLSGNVIAGTISSGTGAGGVDTDPDGDTLVVTTVQSGASSVAAGAPLSLTYGTVTILNSGTQVKYQRTSNYPGTNQTVTDTYTYTISDGRGGTAVGTVGVSIENIGCGGSPCQ